MSEPPVRPKPPEPADFGLNSAALDQIASNSFYKKIANWTTNAILIMGFAGMLTAAREGYFSIAVAVPSALALMATVIALDRIPQYWSIRAISRLGLDPDRVAAFQEAMHAHEVRLREYDKCKRELDEWFLRSQVSFWLSLSPNQFEHEVGKLYRRLGYSAQVTKQSRDGGVDVILRAEHGTTIVQCKAHQRKIGVKSFRELYGVMDDFGTELAILVCLDGATDDALKFIRDKPIRVVGLYDLVQMSGELADDVSENAGAVSDRRV